MKPQPILLTLTGIALGTASASAATTLSVNSDSAAPPAINTSYGFLRAYNLGDSANVNGSAPTTTSIHQTVTFKNIDITGNHATPANSGILELSPYVGDVGGVQIESTTTGDHFGATGSGGLAPDALYGGFIFANATDQAMGISGLLASETYLVQFGFGDARTASFLDFDFSIFLDGIDSGQDITWNSSDVGSGDIYGYASVLVSGQTSLDFDLRSNNSIGPGFSFVTVSQVPEPSVALLGGLGLVGLLRRSRKKI